MVLCIDGDRTPLVACDNKVNLETPVGRAMSSVRFSHKVQRVRAYPINLRWRARSLFYPPTNPHTLKSKARTYHFHDSDFFVSWVRFVGTLTHCLDKDKMASSAIILIKSR